VDVAEGAALELFDLEHCFNVAAAGFDILGLVPFGLALLADLLNPKQLLPNDIGVRRDSNASHYKKPGFLPFVATLVRV